MLSDGYQRVALMLPNGCFDAVSSYRKVAFFCISEGEISVTANFGGVTWWKNFRLRIRSSPARCRENFDPNSGEW